MRSLSRRLSLLLAALGSCTPTRNALALLSPRYPSQRVDSGLNRRRPISTRTAALNHEARVDRLDAEQELRLMTWTELEERVTRDTAEAGVSAVLVPVGATEQHGPTGLIGTDHLTAEAVARDVSKISDTVLAPTLNYGMSVHHGSFAGTVTLSPGTFVSVMQDVTTSLWNHGFTHVMFINGHGGNVGPALKAFAELEDRRRKRETTSLASSGKVDGITSLKKRVKLISWYTGCNTSALAKELYGDQVGQHATPDEVAMTQHLFPASIKSEKLNPEAIKVARELGGTTLRHVDGDTGLSIMDKEDFRRRFPDGRMFSNPGLATPEHGRQILDAAVADMSEALRKFINGEDIAEEAAAAAARKAWFTAARRARRRPRWGDERPSIVGGGKGRWGRVGAGQTDVAHTSPMSNASSSKTASSEPEGSPTTMEAANSLEKRRRVTPWNRASSRSRQSSPGCKATPQGERQPKGHMVT